MLLEFALTNQTTTIHMLQTVNIWYECVCVCMCPSLIPYNS